MMKNRNIYIYCDGGSNVHTGKEGAWAYVVIENNEVIHEAFGSEKGTTNGRMEVLALKHALSRAVSLDKTTEIIIRSDSQYCVKAYNEWTNNWRINKWRKSNNKVIEHVEEWKIIDVLRAPNIKVEWVKGHSGDKWNDYVDALTHNRY